MNIFEKIEAIVEASGSGAITEYFDKDQKAIGYFCSYIPEEVIHAAGFVPYRMRAVGSRGTQKGDVYFASINCTFVRNCFDKVLHGDFSFLQGVVILNGCDHTRRIYDNWRHADVAPQFRYMFTAPHVINDLSKTEFTREISAFITALEENFKITIKEESLKESIRLYNRKRTLLKMIYDLRKEEKVPIHGSELLKIILAVTAIPVEKAIALLEEVFEACRDRKVNTDNDLRLFISSGCMEEPEHLELIEECGAVIVADNLCLGSRHFDTLVDENLEPPRALAERYLTHLSCPRMMNAFSDRLQYVNSIRSEFKVDAVIIEKLKFCDLWGGEIFITRREAAAREFPLLALERELYGKDKGQIKTRIQAFFEQVRNNQEIKDELFTV